ncbi:helix-turn-helix transcriptional regulator [Streptomyces sp. NPDC000410]|uniref:helix-turn-helix domain-containing protein n=1 Tax=Streptomyces sp. NPDC000410 TaxID=3154254 RepID=UPI00331B73DF
MTERRQAAEGEPDGPEDGRPAPEDAQTPAEFVAVMRQLRQWADLSYRQLERRAEAAGDVLPRATLAGALGRHELPREELLSAFVRACGADDETVKSWMRARKRLAVGLPPSAVEESDGADEPVESDEPALVELDEPDEPDEAQSYEPEPEPEPAPVPGQGDAPRAAKVLRFVRRPVVVVTSSAVAVLLAAAATFVSSPPDEGRRGTGPGAPGKGGTTPSASVPSVPAPSSVGSAVPVTDPTGSGKKATRPAPQRTPKATSSKSPGKTTPPPGREDPPPQWPTQDPQDPPPYEPPDPAPSSSSPTGGDPFPEETCWDATEDCGM